MGKLALRPALVVFHRWVGLVLAGFLVLTGLTGALLVWLEELDAAVSPGLFEARPPSAAAQPLDPLVLREVVQAAHPEAYVALVPLSMRPQRAMMFPLYPRPLSDPGQARGAALPRAGQNRRQWRPPGLQRPPGCWHRRNGSVPR